MQVKYISPPIHGFLQVQLDQDIIEYLWRIIRIAEDKNKTHKKYLAGNISQSLELSDQDFFFFKRVCAPLVNYYRENCPISGDPIDYQTIVGPSFRLRLSQFWVNYQYKTEFNPFHEHGAIYSFAIWMKIPYDWRDQNKLPQFKDMNENEKRPGKFEFEYIDTLGSIRNYGYALSPGTEGVMVFFPAKLRHCVYPFYGSDEARVSIAGNLSFLPDE